MKTADSMRPMLQGLKRELVQIYGPRFRQMILYGSYARGDAQEGSDVDILLVLEDAGDPLGERERLSEMLWQFALQYDAVLSVLPVDAGLFASRQKPLFLNVKREGVVI